MRRIVDITAIVLAAAVGWAVLSRYVDQRHRVQAEARVAADVLRFLQEVRKHAAVGQGDINARGWPVTINPEWFGTDPPLNALLSPDRPWVEVAPPEQANLQHPEVRIAADRTLAAFWYNPYQGVVRTRIPASLSDEDALRLYNRLNGCSLTSIYQPEPVLKQPAASTVPDPTSPPTEAAEAAEAAVPDNHSAPR